MPADFLSSSLWALSPITCHAPALHAALLKHRVPALIDLGHDPSAWSHRLSAVQPRSAVPQGVFVPEDVTLPETLACPSGVNWVVVAGDATLPTAWQALPRIQQVTSWAEAKAALTQSVAGLVLKGQESGGRTGSESTWVLLQRVLPLAQAAGVPVWCQGGIGPLTAPALIAAGATGVVLDAIFAALPEVPVPPVLATRLPLADGSETRVVAGGYQVWLRDQRHLLELEGLSVETVRQRLALPDDHPERLWAVGQDVALAGWAQQTYGRVGPLIQAFRRSLVGQRHQAAALKPLAPHAPWAQAHGVRYPIAQGPMTRVSDEAGFAAAVAEAGALPFLALSLMDAKSSRRLLEETRDRLQGRPWGVGVLGFAAPEVLDPQLALLQEIRPAALILAGGRPAQARPFEALGIPCYLHVPSPGLLDLFLNEGATHFIFEGRECGGHVGPRYSLVLWHQAIARLLARERHDDLHLLFAGGIHDADSAAMVSVLAAPLAARGARIGVLMGTAYLATEEAVTQGAILPQFQAKALSGEETVLVETAPGHAIRCLSNGFVSHFAAEKARLQAEQTPIRQQAEHLESLTVGKLRVASKGLDRVQGVLQSVSADEQERDGMYMIGQVAALLKHTTTIAALHESVSVGSIERLVSTTVLADCPAQSQMLEPIAIVGMAALYPGAPDLETYWKNLVEGSLHVTEVPPERWSVDAYYDPAGGPDRSISRWGGFIPDTPFDPLAYGIPPASLAAIEPVQLVSLAVSKQALADAGYDHRDFDRETTSVIFGAEAGMDLGNQYTFRNLWRQYAGDMPDALAHTLPPLTEDAFPGMLVNVISGRIANRLGLGGVNYAVTSACASSLTAIELAVKELRAGTSDMVLAGGADLHNGINDYLMFTSVGALSPTGQCRSFDASADGIALGEGVGVVVLKRLSDATRDGDRIYAVIEGIAGSSDGKGLGLTAPRKEGQKRALDRAYDQAGVLPCTVGLVEAHGTGTVVGDRTELQTLTEIYFQGGALPSQTVLGSVKSQIGHTKCAAGIAGLIKVAKALHHRVLPGTQHIQQPNAGFLPGANPFRFLKQAAPWLPVSPEAPARGAVSAFGFGGANFHAVLAAWPAHQSAQGAVAWPAELFAVRAESIAAARAQVQSIQTFLKAATAPVALRDVANTLWHLGAGPIQWAWVATDLDTLKTQIDALATGASVASVQQRAADVKPGRVALMFPGQGSQYPGMLQSLFVYAPTLQPLLAQAPDVAAVLYPPTAYDDATAAQQQAALTDTRVAQPALGLVMTAAAQWLASFGFQPDVALGHSYGELVALASAGACDTDTLLTLSRQRAHAMMSVVGDDTGAMAAVPLSVAALTPWLAETPELVMANQNSPVQTVVSGPRVALAAFLERLKAAGIAAKPLAAACAFHSPLVAPASAQFAQDLVSADLRSDWRWPVLSNETAAPHDPEPDAVRQRLADHLARPVRFVDQIERLYAEGVRVFVEAGPRAVLSGLVRRILGDRPHQLVTLDARSGRWADYLTALAQLAVAVPDLDFSSLWTDRAQRLDLSQPPRLPVTTWWLNGGGAWPATQTKPQPVAPVSLASSTPPATPVVVPGAQAPASTAVLDYLGNMRALVQAQRDVLLGYLGAPLAASPAPVMTAPAAPVAVVAAAPEPLPVATTAPATSPAALLLSLVSERTGYPTDLLDLDLDLEADLSIDSIKRLEVVGLLAERLNLRARWGAEAESRLAALSRAKTLRAMGAALPEAETTIPTPIAPAVTAPTTTPITTPAEGVDRSALLLSVVSDSTGYPVEALDWDLDLEADLSIDSIKRLEMMGQLLTRLSLNDQAGLRDRLSRCKTLRAVLAALPETAATTAPATADVAVQPAAAWPLTRSVWRVQPTPVPAAWPLPQGQRLGVIADEAGLAVALTDELTRRGAQVTCRPLSAWTTAALNDFDGLLDVSAWHQPAPVDIVPAFSVLQRWLVEQPRPLLAVTGLATAPSQRPLGGSAYPGLMKTLAWEFPDTRIGCVAVDAQEAAAVCARQVADEWCAQTISTTATWAQQQRGEDTVVAETLSGAPETWPLTSESVVLLTGGARGITAAVAMALARRAPARLLLVGRSPLPTEPESVATAAVTDPRQLRQTLARLNPTARPAALEQQAKQLLAAREVRHTLATLEALGASVTYTALDVRDAAAFGAYIDQIYDTYGRLDAVFHGAGVLEDKWMRDKTPESFARVYDTKVRSAAVLRHHLRPGLRWLVFFSSVASAFGNAGQVDYASANATLDALAQAWPESSGLRVLSVNWGPWAETGMVSDALVAEYARKEIGLVPKAEGIQALFDELCHPQGERQVVLMAGNRAAFERPRAPRGWD